MNTKLLEEKAKKCFEQYYDAYFKCQDENDLWCLDEARKQSKKCCGKNPYCNSKYVSRFMNSIEDDRERNKRNTDI